MKRNIFALIMISALLLVICGITIYAFFDKHIVAKNENRNLNQLPSFSLTGWLSKDYSTKLDSFLSDHVFKRDDLVMQAKDFESSMKEKMDVEYVANQKSNRQAYASDVIILQDRILMLYIRNAATIKMYENTLENLFGMIPNNINKYFFIAPTRIEFEKPEYKKYSDSQKTDILKIYNDLPKNVHGIDVYSTLEDKDINKIFFRTDHHWTHLGSYYAANAILPATKHRAIDINNFKQKKASSYLGFLYAKYQVKALAAYPDELYYYTDENIPHETVHYTDQSGSHVKEEKLVDLSRGGYYAFVKPTFEYAVIDGKNKQGGCLLMVADSFGNILTTWLAEQYNTVIIIDPRYFKGGKREVMQLISKHQVTDFMLCQCAMSVVPYFAEQINKLTR
jgi:hypothetical protein